jgi:small GTP-binding protein
MCFNLPVKVGGSEVALSFWDTNGMEEYKSLAPFYLRGSEAIVLVFDITHRHTFTDLSGEQPGRGWADMARAVCPDARLFIVASKIDLKDQRLVEENEVQRLAETLRAQIFEVSALTGDGIDELFTALATEVSRLNRIEYHSVKPEDSPPKKSECSC